MRARFRSRRIHSASTWVIITVPRLAMSMRCHVADPARHLVRINSRLMHESDWVAQDLQLIEITLTGVILDYIGKPFRLKTLL